MASLNQLRWHNRFARLSPPFFTAVQPTPLEGNTRLVAVSPAACALIELEFAATQTPEFLAMLSGQTLLAGMQPLASVYAGHQFGVYVAQLGDGRALLLGESVTASGGWEWHLKGAGRTPYSRAGDGRAVLRSTIREFLCSEAMAALGIPTTRALALAQGDEEVYRERIEQGAMLLRLAPSHLRFGHFEYFFYREDFDALEQLGTFALTEYFPHLKTAPQPYLVLLDEVIERTATLMAQWQLVGFAHGVMNTDNMSLLGLTIDYGPFGFMDGYQPSWICNHSDPWGRYAFDRQPSVAQWNLSCLAQALLPLLDRDNGERAAELARDRLRHFTTHFERAYHQGLAAKLGLGEYQLGDEHLAYDLLRRMAKDQVDYTLLFRALAQMQRQSTAQDATARKLFRHPDAFDQWAVDYRARLDAESSDDNARARRLCGVNPKFVLRNYLAQQAIERAEQGDDSEVQRLLKVLSTPFAEQPEHAAYAQAPPDWSQHLEVSCSS